MYTTVTKVRQIAGFIGNSNVSDSFISSLITRAEGLINSYLSDAYTMPLQKFYEQTITFSGTGTGAGTMTIIVGGESIDVTISTSLTASQAADAFRTAALDNAVFVTDGLGSGEIVTIHSIDGNDSTAVTITSTDPQTVAGITSTGGTVTEVAVPFIENLTTETATAYLLMTEYGPEAQDTDKDGAKRLAMVREILEGIRKKEEKVFDFAGVELARASTKTISFFPADGSEDADGVPIESKFKINQRF
jgi:hypothetical protein